MRSIGRLVLVAAVVLLAVTISGPPVHAFHVNYYNSDSCWQGEHVEICTGGMGNFGTFAGAQYKHFESWSCNDGSYVSIWYYWNGCTWVATGDLIMRGC